MRLPESGFNAKQSKMHYSNIKDNHNKKLFWLSITVFRAIHQTSRHQPLLIQQTNQCTISTINIEVRTKTQCAFHNAPARSWVVPTCLDIFL